MYSPFFPEGFALRGDLAFSEAMVAATRRHPPRSIDIQFAFAMARTRLAHSFTLRDGRFFVTLVYVQVSNVYLVTCSITFC